MNFHESHWRGSAFSIVAIIIVAWASVTRRVCKKLHLKLNHKIPYPQISVNTEGCILAPERVTPTLFLCLSLVTFTQVLHQKPISQLFFFASNNNNCKSYSQTILIFHHIFYEHAAIAWFFATFLFHAHLHSKLSFV